MINKIFEREVTSEQVALADVKRLSFAFQLNSNTNTLPDYLDAVLDTFKAFEQTRDKEKTPDCIQLNFVAVSNHSVDVAALYGQVRNFLDPFCSAGWHTPSLSLLTHRVAPKAHELRLELVWQDKTYDQMIARNFATWRSHK